MGVFLFLMSCDTKLLSGSNDEYRFLLDNDQDCSDEKIYVAGGVVTPTGASRNYTTDKVYASADMENWIEVGTLPFAQTGGSMVVFNGSLFMIGGAPDPNMISANGSVFKSDDGESWDLVGALPSQVAYTVALVFNGKIWAFGGQQAGGTGPLAEVYNSSDGSNWNRASIDSNFSARSAAAGFVYGKKIWLYSGLGSTLASSSNVSWSSDGLNWTSAGAIASLRALPGFAIFKSVMTVVGGLNLGGSAYHDDVFRTQTGTSWTQTTAGLGSNLASNSLVVYDSALYSIGGQNGSTDNTVASTTNAILKSTDGTTFSSWGTFPEYITGAATAKFSAECGTGSNFREEED